MARNTIIQSTRVVDTKRLSTEPEPGNILFYEALRGRFDIQERLEEMRIPVDPSKMRLEIRLSYEVVDRDEDGEEAAQDA